MPIFFLWVHLPSYVLQTGESDDVQQSKYYLSHNHQNIILQAFTVQQINGFSHKNNEMLLLVPFHSKYGGLK